VKGNLSYGTREALRQLLNDAAPDAVRGGA
jgi:hypothetical protein